ncbi:uncharacterized protein LOC111028983 [Myzus persicae]|uniref:uncharacterized protein LOC111028983 n=1 Tax=Myzus persicae TaxID=13164 RepID=UPI000B9340B8|nr:uncharacterized protein LOC111028983 [Myzus persicae]XP_022163485.1 uncharacterized protein LOC111028983 [Myzus persicae]
MMMDDCSYCSCSMTAMDSYCSCDRSIIYVLDLATPRFEIVFGQPPPPDCGKLLSQRSKRVYKSMIEVGETEVQVMVANAEDRKRFMASTEALHRSPADHRYGHAPPIAQEDQSSGRSEVLPPADRESCATNGPQAHPDLQATDLQAPDLRATDLQASDFCTTELQEYKFHATYDPHVAANYYTPDFFAVITPNASDDFDAVDLTGDDCHRQRSVDLGGWEERAPADSEQSRSPENGNWDSRVQAPEDTPKEEGSLWTRFKKYVSCGLCCRQREI